MTILPQERMTEEMLPAIRAIVLHKIILYSGLWLGFWGALLLGVGILAWIEPAGSAQAGGTAAYLRVASGAIMLGFGLSCVITRNPRTVLVDSVLLAVAGVSNIALAFVGRVPGLGRPSPAAQFLTPLLAIVVGLLILASASSEFRRYKALARWAPEAKLVPADVRRAVKRRLKAFVKAGEDLASQRLRAVAKGGFLENVAAKPCRGQTMNGLAVWVSKRLDELLVIPLERARQGKVTPWGSLTIDTEFGRRRLQLWPVSVMLWKAWAGLPATEGDIQRLVKRKKLSLAILQGCLTGEDAEVRACALRSLKHIKGDKSVGEAAAAFLADGADEVRAAALAACVDLRVDGLHDRVIPMLRDPAPGVSFAAARYLTVLPSSSAERALNGALHSGTDPRTQKQIQKAIKACQREVASPYAAR